MVVLRVSGAVLVLGGFVVGCAAPVATVDDSASATQDLATKPTCLLASDGSVIANVHGFAGETDPAALLQRAIEP